MTLVWNERQSAVPPQSAFPEATLHHFLQAPSAPAVPWMQTSPGPHSFVGLHAPFAATEPPSWQSVVPLSSTRQTPVPAAVLPPQLVTFVGSHDTRHTLRFGIA